MGKVALVCGATGIVGKYLVDILSDENCPSGPWKVYALARRPEEKAKICFKSDNYKYIRLNLLDKEETFSKLIPLNDTTHIFWVTWVMGKTEEENCSENGKMFENCLAAVVPHAKNLEYICLQTGAKHYIGPFTGGVEPREPPFREDYPRLPCVNFYHTLEDILFSYVKQQHGQLTYSIHRPTNIFGFTAGNLMNLLGTLTVYAAICKHEGLPFTFPGNNITWDQMQDAASADLIAEQEIWAATTPQAKNQAFNSANGDVFKWKRMWTVLAEELGVEPAPYAGKPTSLTDVFKGKDHVWERIIKEKGLVETKFSDVAHGWFADFVLNVPREIVSSMNKSKEFGFLGFRNTETSIKSILHEMVESKVYPSFHEKYHLRDRAV